MTGLIGWWPLNETSGTRARDLSGNGNHGSLNGGVTQGVAGKAGLTAYSFDGGANYVEASHNANLNITGQISYAFWLKAPSEQSNSDPFVISKENQQYEAHIQAASGEHNMRFIPTNDVYLDTGSDTIGYGEWNHWAVTYDDSANLARVYKNGESISFTNNGGNPVGRALDTSTSSLKFGVRDNSGKYPLEGNIQEIRIYNRILSPQEIQSLYEWGSGDYARPLNDQNSSSAVSRWAFDGDALDSWGNNDGVTTSGVSYSSNSIRGQALDLDGGDDYVEISDDSSLDYSDQVTISAWLYPRGFSEVGPIWDDWKWGSNVNALLFRVETDGQVGFWVSPDASSSDNIFSNRSLTLNNWQHVVATFDSGEARIYFNGTLDKSETFSVSSIYNRSYDKSIGEYGAGGNLNAKIDDVRIYDKALSPSEVFELYRWGTRGRDMRKLTVNARGDQ